MHSTQCSWRGKSCTRTSGLRRPTLLAHFIDVFLRTVINVDFFLPLTSIYLRSELLQVTAEQYYSSNSTVWVAESFTKFIDFIQLRDHAVPNSRQAKFLLHSELVAHEAPAVAQILVRTWLSRGSAIAVS